MGNDQQQSGHSKPIGWIVLTLQPNGLWRDDWDGEVHIDRAGALSELEEAKGSTMTEAVQLGVVYPDQEVEWAEHGARDAMAGVLASLGSRMESEIGAFHEAGGSMPEPTSDQQIAEWQIEALRLAGYEIVEVPNGY